GRIDHFPRIHAYLAASECELVREGDIYAPKRVLQEFGGFGYTWARYFEDAIRHMAIKRRGQASARCGHATDHFRDVGRGEPLVPRIHPLGRESQKEVSPDHKSVGLETRLHHLFGGSWIRRAFQHHELASPEVRQQALDG